MLNIIINGWVKNVNKLSVFSCISSVFTSTELVIKKLILNSWSEKSSVVRFYSHSYTTYLYTYLKRQFNLLNNSFTHNPQYLLIELKREK